MNPEVRRRSLQVQERCKIALVFVYPEQGSREEALHIKLDDYRIEGEWFEGSDEARVAIAKAVKRGCVLTWPFAYDEAGAEAWLDQFLDWRRFRYIDRLFRENLRRICVAKQPDPYADMDIWQLLLLSETGEMPGALIGDEIKGIDNDTAELVAIPKYSTDLSLAMSVWPKDVRPSSWDGTPLECCIAALRVRLKRLPKRQPS